MRIDLRDPPCSLPRPHLRTLGASPGAFHQRQARVFACPEIGMDTDCYGCFIGGGEGIGQVLSIIRERHETP